MLDILSQPLLVSGCSVSPLEVYYTDLQEFGFVEKQRNPLVKLSGGEYVPVLLQPYAEPQAYMVVLEKEFL